MTVIRPVTVAAAVLWVTPVVANPSAAAGSDTPEVRTQKLIEAFKAVKTPSNGAALSAADKKLNRSTFQTLDGYFDFDTMMAATIEPTRASFSPKQREHFIAAFGELIRLIAYPQSGEFLNEAEVKLRGTKNTPGGAEVEMFSTVAAEDLEVTTHFFWQRQKGVWRVVDVSFDGASLVKDYQNQFGRIIKKSGVEDLISKLDARLADERKKSSIN